MIFLQILFPDEEIYKKLFLPAAGSERMFMRMKKKEPEDPIKGGTVGQDLT